MNPRDAKHAALQRSPRLRFDRFILDLDRGSLLLDGNEIALRPKTFAVLRYLSENCERLVSKDELFAAVWPNLAVTDDTLVQRPRSERTHAPAEGPLLPRRRTHVGADHLCESRHRVARKVVQAVIGLGDVVLLFHGDLRQRGLQAGLAVVGTEQRAHLPRRLVGFLGRAPGTLG
jgi:hypothetical protein